MTSRHRGPGATHLGLALMGMVAACGSDQVQPGYYGMLDGGGGDGASSSGGGDAVAPGDTGASSSGGGDGAVAPAPEAGTPTSANCDMNGRWLVAQRVLADAIGQKQASHNWFYYEINQSGDQVTVTRGLQCGFEVVPITALGANVDSHLAWPGILAHVKDTGRKGTMTVAATGCQLALEKKYTVRGATVSQYSDPNQAIAETRRLMEAEHVAATS